MDDWRRKFSVPSRLDAFLQYKTGYLYQFGDNCLEFTNELFVRQLLKLEKPTINMGIGTALHKIIEESQYTTLPDIFTLLNGWKVICEKEITLALPRLREIPIKTYIDGIPIFGKVDGINATHIHDWKITGKFDIERYMSSMQWKTYLTMNGYNNFVYDVIIVDINEKEECVYIKDYQRLPLQAYPGMHQEVALVLHDYWDTLQILKPLIYKMAIENEITIKGLT